MEGWKPQSARSLPVSIEGEEGGWRPVFTLPDAWAAQSFEELILLNGASENQESTETDVLNDGDDESGNGSDGGYGGDGDDGDDDDGNGDYYLPKRQWIGH